MRDGVTSNYVELKISSIMESDSVDYGLLSTVHFSDGEYQAEVHIIVASDTR